MGNSDIKTPWTTPYFVKTSVYGVDKVFMRFPAQKRHHIGIRGSRLSCRFPCKECVRF